MIDRPTARARAAAYVNRPDPWWPDRPPVEILDAHTWERPYGWVFFYHVPGHEVAGNAPILVTREDGELRPLGSAHPTEWYLENFERTGDPFSEPPPAGARWELWRQDDNGNRDRIGTFETHAAARRALDRFEALGHKQIYWLEERAGG